MKDASFLKETIKKMDDKLVKSGRYPELLTAVKKLLTNPTNINLQVDVLGNALLAYWKSNQVKPLQEAFDHGGDDWIKVCLERITSTHDDLIALTSLLRVDVHSLVRQVKEVSPDIILKWDVPGADSCGVGFARIESNKFKDYVYIGWDYHKTRSEVLRIDYINEINPVSNNQMRDLALMKEPCELKDWMWAELPIRYAHAKNDKHSFYLEPYYRSTQGQHILKIFEE